MVRSPGYQGWCFFRALSSAGWMWWMQVGMDTLQKLQLLGNDWESSNWNIQKKMVGYQVPRYMIYVWKIWISWISRQIQVTHWKLQYEDLQRKIHGEMITNSLDSWIYEFLTKHLRNQWVPGLINKNAEATRTLWNMMKHQIPTIGNI